MCSNHRLGWLLIGLALANRSYGLESHNNFRYMAQNPLSTAPTFETDDTPWGLTTYANVPYMPCLSKQKDLAYDIAVLGAPFDTATTGRPGARFGPGAIRSGSSRIYADAAWNLYTGENVFKSNVKIIDCGDVPMTRLDNTVALKQLEKGHDIITSRPPVSKDLSPVARIINLGGDHTTTLAALRASYKRWGKLSVIHFDAHIDTWNPNVLGGDISDYGAVNHGTFLHIAHEEGLITNSSIHAGIRAPLAHPVKDMKNDRRCGFDFVTARDLDRVGTSGIIERLKARVGDANVYISVDIDVLDPAYAPATGTAEPGGWTSRELLTILDGLVGLKVVGADVVEVAPAYDGAGEITGVAAAEVVQSLLYLMVKTAVAVDDR
ncbi:arginase family-domain-containing protein [Triangularia verruculosa]|uniref:Arginase family-domain-containing protein n=1 Tax=Triangularia verruculosa TaxID=2587418 RepID=A0AAN7APB8_9PEZI|nr:arginase family-domain-containing protein [Triangularia verruculosa]